MKYYTRGRDTTTLNISINILKANRTDANVFVPILILLNVLVSSHPDACQERQIKYIHTVKKSNKYYE